MISYRLAASFLALAPLFITSHFAIGVLTADGQAATSRELTAEECARVFGLEEECGTCTPTSNCAVGGVDIGDCGCYTHKLDRSTVISAPGNGNILGCTVDPEGDGNQKCVFKEKRVCTITHTCDCTEPVYGRFRCEDGGCTEEGGFGLYTWCQSCTNDPEVDDDEHKADHSECEDCEDCE
jgi:hypothetical protein